MCIRDRRLGRVLYEGACDVLAQLTLLEKRLHDMVSDETHQIAVSCTRTVCETSVAKVVSQFAQAHPEFQLSVVLSLIHISSRLRLRYWYSESHCPPSRIPRRRKPS